MRIVIYFIIGIVLISCNVPAQQEVSADDFQKQLASPGAQILDVRTPGEYNNGHINNALLADWMNQDQFKERVQYLDKDKPVLVYCASGVRSGQAAKWLSDNGFSDVENMKGGFTQWKLENKPVEFVKPVPQISLTDYLASVNSGKNILVDFGSEWCAPCRKMEPVINALRNEMKDDFKLVKIDGGINTDVMQQLNVSSLPTFIIYKNGKETWRKQGIVDKTELLKQLNN